MSRCSRALIVVVCLHAVSLNLSGQSLLNASPADGRSIRTGDPVDLASFGRQERSDHAMAVQWHNPMDISSVRLEGIPDVEPTSLKVQWWGSVWPANGSGGWMRLDDQWNGQWITIENQPVKSADGTYVFEFPTLTTAEWEKAFDEDQFHRYDGRTPPTYRRTLKVRIVCQTETIPVEASISAFGSSTWARASFDIEFRATSEQGIAGQIDVTHGQLVSITSLPSPGNVIVSGTSWQGTPPVGGAAGVRVDTMYVADGDHNANELTRITVRLGRTDDANGFSFVPQDVFKSGAIRLPDFGALVTPADSHITLASDPGLSQRQWRKQVRRRLVDLPEMTRQHAMASIPRLESGRWVPLGVPSARQEIFISGDGDWSFWGMSIGNRFPDVYKAGKDHQRIPFRHKIENHLGDIFYTHIDTDAEPDFDDATEPTARRYLEDGYLPLIHIEWDKGPIHFHHQFITTTLAGDFADDTSRRGDEAVALLTKLSITNTQDQPAAASVHLRYSHPARFELDQGLIRILPEKENRIDESLVAVRGMISMDQAVGGGSKGWSIQPGTDPKCSSILSWDDTLDAGQTRTIYFKAPFVDLLEKEELHRLQVVEFEKEADAILDYWQRRIDAAMVIDVPDEMLNNFYNANLWHILITTDRDPITGLYNQGVATVRYGVYANETVMIARSLDMRGEHEEAARMLEPMLRFQGHEPLKGRFTSQQGVFHSAGAYTHGEYAMNHGFVLWGLADHYLMTRDEAYLRRVADQMISACDFLIEQRQSTMIHERSRRAPTYGLSPASSLEDVVEYKYWLATNAYFCLGLIKSAEVLRDIDHPEARRLTKAAESYRQDIETAAREAATQSAVVPLRSGYFIPYVPSRIYQWRHLTEGWIREALYPALHLAAAEIVDPADPLITWMLDELEDNIFFSWQSGLNVETYQEDWFERGGVTLQPCLLDTMPTYLARDEIEAALRSFWNTYAVSIYPDTHCFAEWVRKFGVGGGPLYKTSDEARFVIWLRQMLVWENDDTLWFARATPRSWLANGQRIIVKRAATRFGRCDMEINSQTASGFIEAHLRLPDRNPPSQAWLRIRHPDHAKPQQVFINGQQLSADRIVGEDIQLPTPTNDANDDAILTVRIEYAQLDGG